MNLNLTTKAGLNDATKRIAKAGETLISIGEAVDALFDGVKLDKTWKSIDHYLAVRQFDMNPDELDAKSGQEVTMLAVDDPAKKSDDCKIRDIKMRLEYARKVYRQSLGGEEKTPMTAKERIVQQIDRAVKTGKKEKLDEFVLDTLLEKMSDLTGVHINQFVEFIAQTQEEIAAARKKEAEMQAALNESTEADETESTVEETELATV